jgi:hypothetical protein
MAAVTITDYPSVVSSGLNLQQTPRAVHLQARERTIFAHITTVIWSEKDQTYLMYNIGCPQNIPFTCHDVNFTYGPGNTLNGESEISLWSLPDLYTADWGAGGNLIEE